ncbi:MAG: carboxypeptidase-like regulatory domain-containing protein [Planctomycetes bacterium]|nr:carboxypeptidase-like regulatory domain-containing protein [Planctomycetota bacterium]
MGSPSRLAAASIVACAVAAGSWWFFHRGAESAAPASSAKPPIASLATPDEDAARAVVRHDEVVDGAAVLAIRVVDAATSQPIADSRWSVERADGVRLNALRTTEASRGDLEYVPRTDADGRAEFAVPAGSALLVRRYGEAPSLERGVASLAVGERRELELTVERRTNVVRSRVIDARTDQPIADAEVLDLPIGATSLAVLRAIAKSSATGDVEFSREECSTSRVAIGAVGYSPRLFPVNDAPKTIELRRGATLVVRVVGARSGRGRTVVGLLAPLRALATEPSVVDPSDVASWTRSIEGADAVSIADLPANVPIDARLTFAAREENTRQETVTLKEGETRELVFSLEAASLVRGRLRTQLDDVSIVGREIWLAPKEPAREEDVAGPRATTDFTTAAFADTRSPDPWARRDPRRDAAIRIALTDDQGNYRFDEVPPGLWVVGTAKLDRLLEAQRGDRGVPQPVHTTVRVVGSGAEVVANLKTNIGFCIAGRVVDPSGRPVARANVVADIVRGEPVRPAHDRPTSSGSTDDDGTFVLGPITDFSYLFANWRERSAGSMEIVPTETLMPDVDEAALNTKPAMLGLWLTAIDVESKWADSVALRIDGPRSDVKLTLRAGARLSGWATDDGAKPIRASFELQPVAATSWERPMLVVDGYGFAFEPLVPGQYRVLVNTTDHRVGWSDCVTLEDGKAVDDLSIELSPGASISLVIAKPDEHWSSWEIFVAGARCATVSTLEGKSNAVWIPAGHVQVYEELGVSGKHTPVAEFDLAQGESRLVEVGER